MAKIYVIDYLGNDTYEVYGNIGFRRYYGVSLNEAKRKYQREYTKYIGGMENEQQV